LLCKDYLSIIKKPMDLSTIRKKLESGQYQDPWHYIEDVHLMFDNAWLYNKRTSPVYKSCTKVGSTCVTMVKWTFGFIKPDNIVNFFCLTIHRNSW
jgi:Bromodomain